MNTAVVTESKALCKMIADLTDMPAHGVSNGLEVTRSDSLLKNLISRIDTEPARVCTDAEGRITAINPAFSELCGHTFQDLKGRKPGTVLQGPESSNHSVEALRQAIQRREPCVTELVNYHKDGSAYRVRIDLRPVFSNSGELTGYEAVERKLD